MEPVILNALPRVGRRIILRRLGPADLSGFQAYRSDPEVGRYQGWLAQTDREALSFMAEMSTMALFPGGAWVQLAVADRESNTVIGDVGLCVAADGASAEVGVTISPSCQNLGLGTEALREAIALLFDHSAAVQVFCITDARNTPSIRLLERAKMRKTATVEAVFRGEPCTEHTYAIDRHDDA